LWSPDGVRLPVGPAVQAAWTASGPGGFPLPGAATPDRTGACGEALWCPVPMVMLEGCSEEHRTIDLPKNARAAVGVTCEHTNAPTITRGGRGACVVFCAAPTRRHHQERLPAVRCYIHRWVKHVRGEQPVVLVRLG
jgi:hypothetical protein